MAFLDQNPVIGYPLVATLGLLVGSFLNVVILRLPKRMEWEYKQNARAFLGEAEVYDPPPPGIVVEGSHCPHCKHKLSWYENIPVFSWLALRGKCRNCKTPISAQYPAIELLTMVLVTVSVWRFGFGWQGFGAALFSCFLISLAGIDLRTKYLPDSLTLPLLWLGLIASVDKLYIPANAAIAGAVLGYLSLWSVWWLFKQITGKEGMGFGDFKLLAAMGAWVGYQGLLPIILISTLIGAVVGSAWLLLSKQGRSTQLPFGPYLALAGWIVMLWGDQIIGSYLRLTGMA